MRYFVCPYQHKSKPFDDALKAAGHTYDRVNPEVALFDRDWFMHNDKEPRHEVLRYPNSTIMVYPHSALPPWWYDGLIKIQPYVKCVFVIGEGQKKAMQVIAPEAHVETTGWPWCDIVPFRELSQVKKILFAPVHPAGGRLRPEALEANRTILRKLSHLADQYDITVRYVGNRHQQGLRRNAGMTWVQGFEDGTIAELDAADVVIAEGTMMYMSVARGKPTIGINQHLPVRANKMSDRYTPHNWDKYGPDMAYPINFGDAPLAKLIDKAVSGEQSEWRKNFIGDKIDASDFATKVEKARKA